MIIEINEIKKLIPHRDPFLFLDRCEIIKLGYEGIGFKQFKSNEYFFKGHFPNMPIVPGVILVEALAQTAGVVVSKKFDSNDNKSVLFMSVSMAKFRKPVLPNDNISFHVSLIQSVKSVYKFKGQGFKENVKVCESEFSAMITDRNIL